MAGRPASGFGRDAGLVGAVREPHVVIHTCGVHDGIARTAEVDGRDVLVTSAPGGVAVRDLAALSGRGTR